MNPILLSQNLFCLKTKSTRSVLACFACVGTLALALCNTSCATSRGFGQDVQQAGENIEDAARR